MLSHLGLFIYLSTGHIFCLIIFCLIKLDKGGNNLLFTTGGDMKRLSAFIMECLILSGLLFILPAVVCSQWGTAPNYPPQIGFENPSLRPPLWPNNTVSDSAWYPGASLVPGYAQLIPPFYNGPVDPLTPYGSPQAYYPGMFPFSSPGLPGPQPPVTPTGWNTPSPWPYQYPPSPALPYSPGPAGLPAGGFFPSSYAPPGPYGPYTPQWTAGDFYLPPDDGTDSESADGSDGNAQGFPSDLTGVWIGTWTPTQVSGETSSGSSTSISITQEGNAASGIFFFIGHSFINNLGAIGLVNGNEVLMSASSGEGESKKTISFEGEILGVTWTGKYKAKNSDGTVIEKGEFTVSRI
jgi:hypothetical protein